MVFYSADLVLDLCPCRAGRRPPRGAPKARPCPARRSGARRASCPSGGGPRPEGWSRLEAEPERSTGPERPARWLGGPWREQRERAGRGPQAIRPGPEESATARRLGGASPARNGRARAGRDCLPVAGTKRPDGRRPSRRAHRIARNPFERQEQWGNFLLPRATAQRRARAGAKGPPSERRPVPRQGCRALPT